MDEVLFLKELHDAASITRIIKSALSIPHQFIPTFYRISHGEIGNINLSIFPDLKIRLLNSGMQ